MWHHCAAAVALTSPCRHWRPTRAHSHSRYLSTPLPIAEAINYHRELNLLEHADYFSQVFILGIPYGTPLGVSMSVEIFTDFENTAALSGRLSSET